MKIKYWTGCARKVQGQIIRTLTGLPCFTLKEARKTCREKRHNAIFIANAAEHCTNQTKWFNT